MTNSPNPMRHLLITTAAMLAILPLAAQEDMAQVWTARLEHKIDYTGTDPNEGDDRISFAASDKEMTVFRNKDGSVVWMKAFKELSPNLKKIDELIPFWESKCVFLFERKTGKDQIAVIDLTNGTALWTTAKYQNLEEDNVIYISEKDAFCISTKDGLHYIKARTGEEMWATMAFTGAVGKYIVDGDDMTCVNFVGPGLAALFTGFKNQVARIDLKTGALKWENTYVGRAERKVVTRDFIYDLKLEQGKVFLMLNGIQVYDYATGAQQWSAAFDFTPEGITGAPAHAIRFGVYGAIAEPVVDGNDLYVVDMQNKKKQFVKKFDRQTGKLLWTSPEIKEAKAIPRMYVADGKVILQIGGLVETQAYIRYWQDNPDGTRQLIEEWRVQYKNIKPLGLQAFNASDGALAWDSERFKKSITNCFIEDDRLYVCSGKALYAIDHKTGGDIYEVDLADDGVGLANAIFPYTDMVAVVGEKGVATHRRSDGSRVNSNKWKVANIETRHDRTLLMKTDNSDIAAFDLNNCSYKQFNARKGAVSSMSYDGDFVYVYEKKDVTKLRTH